MNSRRESSSVVAHRSGVRMTRAAASALVTVLMLSGCVPSVSAPVASTPTSTPSASATPSSTPIPTPDPLVVVGCDTLLPLSTAKGLFSPATVLLDDSNTVPLHGGELAEIVAAVTNASVTKNCIWGIPNSDGYFSVVIADIVDPDIANLTSALVAGGYTGSTNNGLTTLEFETEGEVSGIAHTHVLVNDLWVYVAGTALELTTNVANTVLDELRLANPTRTF